MEFASPAFFIFSVLVILLVGVLAPRRSLPLWLLANLTFILSLDWRFAIFCPAIAFIEFRIAQAIHDSSDSRRRALLLWFSILLNLLVFIVHQTNRTDSSGLLSSNPGSLGLSFFLLQVQGYVLDVSRRTVQPATSFREFLGFSTFFLTLMAGPIERFGHLSPQLRRSGPFQGFSWVEGLQWVALGLFKRSVLVPQLYSLIRVGHPAIQDYRGLGLVLYCILAFLQMYLDFSAYVDIARGLARLARIDLVPNFHLPYLASGPFDFWRRWHISLLDWVRDFVYVPILLKTKNFYLSTAVLFLLVGFWHGRGFHTFSWAIYWVLIFSVFRLCRENFSAVRWHPFLKPFQAGFTLVLVSLSTLPIASASPSGLVVLIQNLFRFGGGFQIQKMAVSWPRGASQFGVMILLIMLTLVFEFARDRVGRVQRRSPGLWMDLGAILVLVFLTSLLGESPSYQFIYFVF